MGTGPGPAPTTHSAHRPGRRSRGGSGRRPCGDHRCRCGGRRTPGCRRPRSAPRGRLERAAGRPPAVEVRGHRGGPRALACFRGPGAGPPACPAGSDTHPARSAAPSSPGRRSSCRWPGGTGPRFCRHTSVHSSRQTGSGDSLQTEAVLGALAYGYTCSETHPHQVRHALNKRFPGPPGPVSTPGAHGYQGAMPSPPSFQSAQARPDPEPRVIRGKGAWALQGL